MIDQGTKINAPTNVSNLTKQIVDKDGLISSRRDRSWN